MKKILLSLAITTLVAFSFATHSILAQTPDEGDMMGGPPPCEMDEGGPPPEAGMNKKRMHQQGKFNKAAGNPMGFFKALNLTEDQKTKIKALKETAKNQIKSLREQLVSERDKLMTTIFAPDSSKAEMLAQQDKLSAVQDQMEKIRIDNIVALKAILTPEQKEKLSQLANKRLQKMQERRQQWKNKSSQKQNKT